MLRRKIIQIAKSTMMVSLPRVWIKKNNLVKGCEVDLTMDNDKVIISCNQNPVEKTIAIDVGGRLPMIEKMIGAVYRAGYDRIEVSYRSNEEHMKIHEVVSGNVIGYEIIDEKQNKVIVKAVSGIQEEEFSPMLRRGFLFLMAMGEDSAIMLGEGRYDDLKSIATRDYNINKISDFCRRTINKYGHKDYPIPTTIYAIAMSIERLGDLYKELATYMYEKKPKIGKELLQTYKDTNSLVRDYYDCFYSFNLDKVAQMSLKKKKIIASIDKLLETEPKENRIILAIMRTAVIQTSDMTGVLMVNYL